MCVCIYIYIYTYECQLVASGFEVASQVRQVLSAGSSSDRYLAQTYALTLGLRQAGFAGRLLPDLVVEG